MKSNDDKLIREKLAGNEFPFDPQAWAQMEAMLDEKKKRRGFFWWWTGGIAAVLLLALGTIGWGLYLMKEDDGLTGEVTFNTSEVIVTETEPAATVSLEGEGGGSSGQVNTTTQAANAVSEKGEVNAVANLIGTSGVVETARNKKEDRGLVFTKNKSKKSRVQKSTASIRVHPSNLPAGRQGPRHPRANASTKKNTTTPVSENPYKKEAEMLNSALAKSNAQECISMTSMSASLLQSLSENTTPEFAKTEEDALPKQKKKIFSYSLGVLANVSGTTLGKQAEGNLFYNKPSYLAGITYDFLFVNRIAISNSVLYSQTSYKVYEPKTVTFDKAPLSYSSQITELAIPIGIKVYPVVKSNFRFYVGAGIINHIKLKETFAYNMPPDTALNNVVTTPPSTFDPFTANVPPTQTDFTGNGIPYEKVNTMGLSSTEYANTNDFSINSAKRYYASFYTNAGVEYVAYNRWKIFAEPQFHFSLEKIGVQDKRKYNLGLNAGFRYEF